jgi:hypothetical protein
MPWFAFGYQTYYAWASIQNETGRRSSLFPLPSSLLPTTYAPLPTRSAEPLRENRW